MAGRGCTCTKVSTPSSRKGAPNVLLLPLPKGKLPGTWKVEIVTVAGNKLRLSGQVNRADYASGELVGGYVTYYPNGKIEKQVAQDGRGRQHGIGSKYYPDGTLELARQLAPWLARGRRTSAITRRAS